jgi:hypothetical protein
LTSIVILDAYFSGGPEQVFRNKKPEHWLLLGTDCPVDKPGKAFLSCYRSLLRHIGLAVSNLHWVHNIRGQLAALQVGSGDSMAIGHRGPQTSCQCVNWSHFWCHSLHGGLNLAGKRVRQGVKNTLVQPKSLEWRLLEECMKQLFCLRKGKTLCGNLLLWDI